MPDPRRARTFPQPAQDPNRQGEWRGRTSDHRCPCPASSSRAEPMNTPPGEGAADHLAWARAVALHLLPGTLTMAALLALTPALVRAGCPRVLAYQVAVGLVGIPVMLGVMCW